MPERRDRVAVAIATAIVTVAVCAVKQHQTGPPTDFAMFWTAARMLVGGGNPYTAIHPGGVFRWDSGYLYPLPGAVVLIPLAWLPVGVAAMVFSASGMGALAYLLTRDGWQRWPILMSAPALWAVSAGQWSPWVMCAALAPGMAWVASVKPNIGAAMWLMRPSVRWIAVALVLPILSLAFMPSWPLEWLRNTAHARAPEGYHVPLLVPGGVVLLLALARWRNPEARLLLGMAIVPQTLMMYDQLPLGLLARTRIQAYLFGLWSFAVPVLGWYFQPAPDMDKLATMHYLSRVLTWGYYLPLLVMILLRPNRDGSLASA